MINSERITNGSAPASLSSDSANSANQGLKSAIGVINEAIAATTIQVVKDQMVDPFKILVQQDISVMKKTIEQTQERFQADVVEAVKGSRRELIEGRLQQFNVEDLISKLISIPESISNQQTELRKRQDTLNKAKDRYQAEIINVMTAAAGQGMVGENASDRDAIKALFEDRIVNAHAHPTLIDLVFQSTGRSKATLECFNIDITKAREVHGNFTTAEYEYETERIELDKLNNQFKSLRSVSALIQSVVS